jgi:hypothetical protein
VVAAGVGRLYGGTLACGDLAGTRWRGDGARYGRIWDQGRVGMAIE